MNPHDIGKAYDQITHLWETEGFNRNNCIDQHKRAIAFVKNRGKSFDVGCGCTGRFIDFLLSEGFSPEGVDVSNFMIAIDTNILIRFLFKPLDNNNPKWQIDAVEAVINKADKVFISSIQERGISQFGLDNLLGVLVSIASENLAC